MNHKVNAPILERPLNLICLPFAGGGSLLFSTWRDMAPPGLRICPVCLPGREQNFDLPPIDDLRDMLDWLDREIAPLTASDHAFFGHSMGAVIAYAQALKQRAAGRSEPRHVFVSAAVPPPNPRTANMHTKPPDEMRAYLRRYDPDGYAFDDHPELWEVFEPVLRADFKLVETYTPPLGANKISCPITAISGTRDALVEAVHMAGWRNRTNGRFDEATVDGGHLFLRDNPKSVFDLIRARLPGSV
jgi:surfactin synthase thioesterase subunit